MCPARATFLRTKIREGSGERFKQGPGTLGWLPNISTHNVASSENLHEESLL